MAKAKPTTTRTTRRTPAKGRSSAAGSSSSASSPPARKTRTPSRIGRTVSRTALNGTNKRPSKNVAPSRRASSPKPKAVRPPPGPERRQNERSPMMVLEIKGKHYDKIFIGYAENISRSGLCFSAANPPAVGTTFPVELVLPDNRTMVQCTCRVVWQRRVETTGRPSVGVGVEFVDLDQAKRQLIDQWVKRNTRLPRGASPGADG